MHSIDDGYLNNPMQALVDGIGAQLQRDRAQSQLTLGALITVLEDLPLEMVIEGLDSPHSYRGYYSDLAFEDAGQMRTVGATLAMCRGVMGQVLQGYKGGDYVMGALTPLWVATYGCCGQKILSLDKENGTFWKADDA